MSRMRATGMLAAALLLSGGAFDSPSLYVPGIGLALVAAAAAAWVRLAARGASAERLRGPWSVVEEEPYPLRFAVRRGRVPGPGGELVDPLLDDPVPIAAGFEGELEVETRFARRGRRDLAPVVQRIRDPFGLRSVNVTGSDRAELLVLPRAEPVIAPAATGGLSRQGGEGSSRGDDAGLDAEAVDFEIDGLRPYRVGSPASRIHWRSVARSGELLEHRLISGGGSDPLVVLDAHEPSDPEALDRAVRAAASLCLHLARGGGCTLLLPGESRPRRLDRTLRGWPELHARLALVERTRRSPSFHGRRSGAVYWVSAAGGAARTAARAGLVSGFLVTPGEPRDSDAFAVSGCRGRALEAERERRLVRAA
jgi:uncharacterized protein (DUF58 family)